MSNAGWKWNPAPGWPEAPRGWVPPEGWSPDSSWPAAPEGWQFWLPEVTAGAVQDETATTPSEDVTTATQPVAAVSPAEITQPKPALPGIGSYPGFVTEAKVNRSRWFGKTSIGMAAGLAGLIIGLASAGDTDAAKDEAEKDAQAKIARMQDQTDELVDEAKQEAKQEALADEQEAIDDAVAAAVAEEKARRAKLIKAAVAEAVKDTKADLKVSAQPKTLASSTDPHFGTCGEANAAGYGTYRRGTDPEYDWYDDRDNDGVVCE